jgi:hypothetical protein
VFAEGILSFKRGRLAEVNYLTLDWGYVTGKFGELQRQGQAVGGTCLPHHTRPTYYLRAGRGHPTAQAIHDCQGEGATLVSVAGAVRDVAVQGPNKPEILTLSCQTTNGQWRGW